MSCSICRPPLRKSTASLPQRALETPRGADEAASGRERATSCATLGSPRFGSQQITFRIANNGLEPCDFCGEHAASQRSQSVISPPRIPSRGPLLHLFDATLDHQLSEIVVQRPRAKFVLIVGLLRDSQHDPVAMQVLASQREQDVQHRRRQWQKFLYLVFFVHTRVPLYRDPSVMSSIDIQARIFLSTVPDGPNWPAGSRFVPKKDARR